MKNIIKIDSSKYTYLKNQDEEIFYVSVKEPGHPLFSLLTTRIRSLGTNKNKTDNILKVIMDCAAHALYPKVFY